MSTTIDRTWYNTLVDDDGSGTTGSVWDKADVDSFLDAIDALLAANITFGGTVGATGYTASIVAALTTAAESWLGPTSTTGVYFKGGFVGIGTVTPDRPLTISKAGGGELKLADATTGKAWLFQSGESLFRLYDLTGAAYRLTVDLNGNFGIGTQAPLSELCINGGLHVGGDSDVGDNNALIDGTLTVTGATTLSSIGAFVASDKYLVVDASGNIHKSATGPAS